MKTDERRINHLSQFFTVIWIVSAYKLESLIHSNLAMDIPKMLMFTPLELVIGPTVLMFSVICRIRLLAAGN